MSRYLRVADRSVLFLPAGAAAVGLIGLLAAAGGCVPAAPPPADKTPTPSLETMPESDPLRPPETGNAAAPRVADEDPRLTAARERMVEQQMARRDITDPRVLAAMRRVPRHLFVAPHQVDQAYEDRPLPIGHSQTISQPYVVALMTQLARPRPGAKALDVGTGSGYQAAVLAELCDEVYGIEIVEPLADQARERLAALGYDNVVVRHGDGYRGWPEHAPFDVIILAAAPDHIPEALTEQLAVGGRLVLPLGSWWQELIVIEKQMDGSLRRENFGAVQFVPMTGEAQQ